MNLKALDGETMVALRAPQHFAQRALVVVALLLRHDEQIAARLVHPHHRHARRAVPAHIQLVRKPGARRVKSANNKQTTG